MEFVKLYLDNLTSLFIDMSLYIMIGLLTVGMLKVFVSKDWMVKQIGKNNLGSVVKASVIGVPLPLCSCGVVPTAIELEKSGGSKGAVVSFLTSTPQTGVDSIIATYGMLGGFMAFYRAIAAFVSGIVAGILVNIFGKNEEIVVQPAGGCGCGCGHVHEKKPEVKETHSCCSSTHTSCCSEETEKKATLVEKVKTVFVYGFGDFLDEIAVRFLIGLVISAFISTMIPDDFFMSYGLNNQFVSMVMMVLIGLPMYICSTASIPIAVTMIFKGLSVGAAFVFLFAGPITNFASVAMISKSLGKKITTIYIVSAIGMSMVFGYLLDYIIAKNMFNFFLGTEGCVAHANESIFGQVITVVFAVLLAFSLVRSIKNEKKH